jgi:hypothetical protein
MHRCHLLMTNKGTAFHFCFRPWALIAFRFLPVRRAQLVSKMHRRGSIIGLSNHLKFGLQLYIGSKDTELSSFAGLASSRSACWKYQIAAFSTTRSSFSDNRPSPRACKPARRLYGHPKLPWKPEVQLVGRDDALQMVQGAVEEELSQTCAARNLWHVAYAAGRAGSGKTEIGKQLPRILARNLRKGPQERALLSNSAYLLIECNGGGDGFGEQDKALEPRFRLGWRLLAAVCRDTIDLEGVTSLRVALEEKGPTSVAQQLEGRGFPNVAKLVNVTLMETTKKANLGHPMTAEAVLRALARDLRRKPDSDERVAIIVHVDEHQLMWGKGLPTNADEETKLEWHKQFLYDLCTLRGNGNTTWCRKHNIFMFPIFTGTASAVLASLLGPTHFTKLHLKLQPFSAEDARTLFLRVLKSNRDDSWLKSNTSAGKPMDFVLSELGRIPRLIINAANNTQLRQLFTKACNSSRKAKTQKKMVRSEVRLDLVHQAFDIVQTLYPGSGLSEQLTRLIVAGVEVEEQTLVDGKTIAQHESEGFIIQHFRVDPVGAAAKPAEAVVPQNHQSDPTVAKFRKFAIRVPATEYRASVIDRPGLEAISAFANMKYSCPGWNGRGRKCTPWPELFEMMMLERFQNILVVHRDILKRTAPMTIEELYPNCVYWSSKDPLVRQTFPLPACGETKHCVTLCHDDKERHCFVYNKEEWSRALQALTGGSCHSRLLTKDHPAFDVMHLHREGKVVRCFLEQVKNRISPTRDLLPSGPLRRQRNQETSESVCDVLDKFLPVMVQMTTAAKDQGLELQFIPVYCDRWMPTDADVAFWSGYWEKRGKGAELTIAASVAGSRMAIPRLFPCLEHRFVLLEEPSLKPSTKGVGKGPLNRA